MKSIIIHGGAWNMPKNLEEPHLKGVREACKAGRDLLLDGKKSADAVTDALTVLEDDETFDAGVGSFLSSAGSVELDAGMMTGENQDFASCGSVTRIKNPIRLCRKMLDVSPNKLLVCEGAHQFAQKNGIVLIDNLELVTKRELDRYNKYFSAVETYFQPSDTVGAVALDGNGNITAANTTGGTPGKPPGRVGDSPIVGCGIYAGKLAGMAATGLGEPIIKTVLTKAVYDKYKETKDIWKSSEHGIKALSEYGWGGVIALDRYGNHAAVHNTTKMPYAFWNEISDKIEVKIKSEKELDQ